ncbi:MAG: hypothetical protein IT479_07565 [Xanthomonadales bacterium]|nr:hypothetical protein [Xanthomonadales bacterium]MCC6593117.1 hypothetical protein [Xanthomonadales bacterium]MCE7930275.1 hypothetical protein [Xanthomonadales bacterium PRO6]
MKATLALALWMLTTYAFAGGASGCTDIGSVAPFTQFRYTQFQAIFDTLTDPEDPESGLCTRCHPGDLGAGGLGLGAGFSYASLVGVGSAQLPGLLRVAPGDPLASLLFQKLNCDEPEVGVRMPPGGTVTLSQQALFFDWIRYGAPLSRLGFEDR